MKKISDIGFIAIVTVTAAGMGLIRAILDHQMYGILLVIIPLVIGIQLYVSVVKKLAASVRAAQQVEESPAVGKYFLKAFLAGNLSSIVFVLITGVFWGTFINLISHNDHTGPFSGADIQNVISASPLLSILYFLLLFLIPICSGYVAAYVSNRSEILHGALSTTLLLLYSLGSHQDSTEHAWKGIYSLLNNLLAYGAPVFGAAAGYLRMRCARANCMITAYRANRIGEKARLFIALTLMAIFVIFTEYSAVTKESAQSSLQGGKLDMLTGAFIMIDAIVVLIVFVLFLFRNWLSKSKTNQIIGVIGVVLCSLLALSVGTQFLFKTYIPG